MLFTANKITAKQTIQTLRLAACRDQQLFDKVPFNIGYYHVVIRKTTIYYKIGYYHVVIRKTTIEYKIGVLKQKKRKNCLMWSISCTHGKFAKYRKRSTTIKK